ncbi:MAG: FTR1 family iron permease [Promethearchaeota archaeon]
MIVSLIITFRETLEAALIIGIILSYLSKIKRQDVKKYVYIAGFLGIIISVISGFLIYRVLGGFEGQIEQVFEGTLMMVGAFLISTVIIWMMHQANRNLELQAKVEKMMDKSEKWGIFLLVFTSVLREGIETVIFLRVTSQNQTSTENSFLGAIIGISLAIMIGILIYQGSLRMNLKIFFQISNIILILMAAGLVAHGLHELQEASVIPIVVEHMYDINHLLNENGTLGSILKGLFGYNGNPSLLEILSYIMFLILAFLTNFLINRKNQSKISDQ